MKKDRIGGSNTTTGAAFEEKVELETFLSRQKGYFVKDNNVYFNQNPIARLCKKHNFYKYLQEYSIQWDKIISKQLLPDDAIHVTKNDTMFIIEYKSQKVPGSVDEKITTCDFKKDQYKKLLPNIVNIVEYIYILEGVFEAKSQYEDHLNYIIQKGCRYYFASDWKDLKPLQELGLPYLP